MSNLPEYLRMRVNASPNAKNVVTIGDVRITVITPRLIRIEQGAFTDEATQVVICRDFYPTECIIQQAKEQLFISTGYLNLHYKAGCPLETLTISANYHPAFKWCYGQKPLQNLGGTTSTLDCVDGACPLEDGLCSIDGYAVLDDSQSVRMTADGWFAGREKCTDVYFFGYGHDYTAAVQDYQKLTGAPGMLPAYALGNWWSRYHAYTDEEYLGLMDAFRAHDVPLSVGIVDMDWHLVSVGDKENGDGWTGYTWNRELFPDYRAFLRGLHDRGLKTALNLHPRDGVRHWDDQYEAMCAALGKDPATKKKIPFNCLNPDFLKAYFEVLHFPYEKDGVDFWWMDWQQGSDYKSIAGADYVPSAIESIKPLWMVNHMHSLASRREGGRGMIFSRFAGYGSQRYPIGFSGDSTTTWASLAFQPCFTATASNVGYGWWSHDIGGHMGGFRDDELTARWVQFGVFSPIFRLHSTNSLFASREPWTYNPRAEAVISRFMRLRHQLFPYLYTMNRRAHTELLPLMRPMYHLNPECTDAYQVGNEYWFGSEMIAAPITAPADATGLAAADVWLPEGVWTDAMTGFIYKGNQRLTVARRLEEMPLFLKAGAILPLQAHQLQGNALGRAENMHVVVAPGASNAFRLYEDDGVSLDFQQGKYAETPLSLDWADKAATFTIHPVEGDTSLVPEKHRWTVAFRGWRKGCHFAVNGETVNAAYTPERNTYVVTLEAISPADAVEISVTHAEGLIHDNRDWRDRVIDCLTRAQMEQDAKTMLLKCVEDAVKLPPEQLRPLNGRPDLYPNLGAHLYEIMRQLH